MQWISKYNKGIRFLLWLIDIYSKYAWVAPSNDKKDMTITNAFQTIFDKSRRKRNKIWVDKGSEIYDRPMKSWFQDSNTELYSTHKERKSVVAERSIRALKNKIYKYMTSISKTVYIDKLNNIINKYNNIYHRTIKMKPVDVKSGICILSTVWSIMTKILNLNLAIM